MPVNFNDLAVREAAAMAALDELPPINAGEVLRQATEFIARYLQCSEHQRTLLALWILHTHCLSGTQVTPYLAIQSNEKQSGKTLCLQLLSLLCESPALTAGFTANTLTRRIDGPISTVLLDECQATIGTRARSKAPALRAILASGYHCGPGYTDNTHERNAFAPKAFAGMGQLPEALADRCLSIVLKPLQCGVTPGSGAEISNKHAACNAVAHSGLEPQALLPKVERFNLRRASEQARPLQEQLRAWSEDHEADLTELPSYSRQDFPPNLSPRRQDMIEPLLQLADMVGGDWPARIREALAAVFQEQADFELSHSIQFLADIRDCFAHNHFPDRLSTSTVLEWMRSLPTRPWDAEVSITARTIARLLDAFEIHPRVQRIGSSNPARGYQLEDFVSLWETHLAFDPALVTSAQESQIINKDAGCNAVTHAGEVSDLAQSNLAHAGKLEEDTPGLHEEPPQNNQIQSQEPWQNGSYGIPAGNVSGVAAVAAAS